MGLALLFAIANSRSRFRTRVSEGPLEVSSRGLEACLLGHRRIRLRRGPLHLLRGALLLQVLLRLLLDLGLALVLRLRHRSPSLPFRRRPGLLLAALPR